MKTEKRPLPFGKRRFPRRENEIVVIIPAVRQRPAFGIPKALHHGLKTLSVYHSIEIKSRVNFPQQGNSCKLVADMIN